MSPIHISSKKPVHICTGERELMFTPPVTEYEVVGTVYVRPQDKGEDYTVEVNGFDNAPGGMLESRRLSPGSKLDELTLTTQNDTELSDELGLSGVIIDGVRYTATNPLSKKFTK